MDSTILKTKNKEPLILLLAKNEFTVLERRIYWLILNQIEQGFNIDQNLFQNKVFQIPLSALKETNVKRLKETAEKLMSRKVKYESDDDEKFDHIIPFPEVRYDGKKGYIEVYMYARVVPYFMELKRGYSEYELYAALSLVSEYAQRLYTLLSRWKDTGIWFNVSIEEFKVLMGAEGYNDFFNLKKRVIEIAQKEINDKTDILFEIEYIKTGRNFTHLTFRIVTKEKQRLIDAHDNVLQEMESVSKLNIGQVMAQVNLLLVTQYNFSTNQQRKIINDPKILQLFIEEDSKITHGIRGEIKNKTAYMATILGFSKKKVGLK
ncbi:MAG: replication initiation protein [Arcicella sp.]|jgi:plasmid replication initiation protein|nr:replication initiation protein [Arcicella sp.]